MALIYTGTLTANGTLYIPLINSQRDPGKYTVQVYGTFGGGTITPSTNSSSTKYTATTNDIGILDSIGVAVSLTAKGAFDFWANSDWINPNLLKIALTGATSPSITVDVFDGS